MLVQNTGQLEVPGSSADEFAFFPLALFGGTLSTRLMAALLLAHGGYAESASSPPSINQLNW
jgi:hypothetical protein